MSGAAREDLSGPRRFAAHLESRDADAAVLVSSMLDDGWTVESFWGPEQMDVWELRLARGGVGVRFGVERGLSDGVQVSRRGADHAAQLGLLVLVYARATATALELDDRQELPRASLDLQRAALDWYARGKGDAALARVQAAWVSARWRDLPRWREPDEEKVRARHRGIHASLSGRLDRPERRPPHAA